MKYVDLGLTGGSANSLPWISAVFSYVPPCPLSYYDLGVFRHLVGSFSPVPGVQQNEVLLLLNPHESFNKVIPDSSPLSPRGQLLDAAELFGLFSGDTGGLDEHTRNFSLTEARHWIFMRKTSGFTTGTAS